MRSRRRFSFSRAKKKRKKSYFKIIPRAPKIEQTRVKKKKGGKVTNYFYNSIESARYFISKGFPRLFCIIQNSIRLSRFNPPYEIRNTSCNTEESTSKCTRKKIKNSQTRSISESLKKKNAAAPRKQKGNHALWLWMRHHTFWQMLSGPRQSARWNSGFMVNAGHACLIS